jgi:hypothetical protein
MEDVELPALEVGDDDVRPGQQFAGGLRCGLYVRLMQVAGLGQRPVCLPTVGRDGAAELDLGAGGLS